MVPALLCALAVALSPAAAPTPFEDVQRRFHLALPTGWQFAPQPGDTGGATFRRTLDGAFVNGVVRVMPFTEEVSIGAFVERIVAASVSEPGYRQLFGETCQVAGANGYCRRYVSLVNGDPHLAKMAEQHLLVRDRVGYVVHAEALAEAFVAAERDVQQFLRSFAVGPAPSRHAPRRHPHMADLLGAWRSRAGNHALELTQAGSLVLDGLRGSYRIDQGTLVATFAEDTQVYGLDFDGRALVLSGGPFGEGEHFDRDRPRGTDRPAAVPAAGGKRTKKGAKPTADAAHGGSKTGTAHGP